MTEQEKPTGSEQEIFQRRPKPEKQGKEKIAIGYILCFCGGLLGAFIGLQLYFAKRTTAHGEQVYAYSENARKHGRNIIFLALGSSILWVLIRFNMDDLIYNFS